MESSKVQRTLTDDQIRVTADMRTANDVLTSAKPHLDAALDAIRANERLGSAAGSIRDLPPIPVPPTVLRDLVVMLMSEVKRAGALIGGGGQAVAGDAGDGDWNPFEQVDFEFD